MDDHDFSMVECDIPEGITLDAWRCRHCDPMRRQRRSLRARLLRRRG
jgi:hypothetical protein